MTQKITITKDYYDLLVKTFDQMVEELNQDNQPVTRDQVYWAVRNVLEGPHNTSTACMYTNLIVNSIFGVPKK